MICYFRIIIFLLAFHILSFIWKKLSGLKENKMIKNVLVNIKLWTYTMIWTRHKKMTLNNIRFCVICLSRLIDWRWDVWLSKFFRRSVVIPDVSRTKLLFGDILSMIKCNYFLFCFLKKKWSELWFSLRKNFTQWNLFIKMSLMLFNYLNKII